MRLDNIKAIWYNLNKYAIMSIYMEVMFMELEKTKLIELKEKFDSIINTKRVKFIVLELFLKN